MPPMMPQAISPPTFTPVSAAIPGSSPPRLAARSPAVSAAVWRPDPRPPGGGIGRSVGNVGAQHGTGVGERTRQHVRVEGQIEIGQVTGDRSRQAPGVGGRRRTGEIRSRGRSGLRAGGRGSPTRLVTPDISIGASIMGAYIAIIGPIIAIELPMEAPMPPRRRSWHPPWWPARRAARLPAARLLPAAQPPAAQRPASAHRRTPTLYPRLWPQPGAHRRLPPDVYSLPQYMPPVPTCPPMRS